MLDTIRSLFGQSFPPERILIIDNGDLTLDFLDENFKGDGRISLHRMGNNSGPAGAAAEGLRLLAEDGYEWIYWGDDNDPPPFPTMFEELLAIDLDQKMNTWGYTGICW